MLRSNLRFVLLFGVCFFIACGGSKRVLLVQSDPPDASVCIKGRAKSEHFSNQKSCVGTTPFEATKVQVTNPDGKRDLVSFSDVESDHDQFYVIVSKPGYVPVSVQVPDWEHKVTLKSEAIALAPPPNPVQSQVIPETGLQALAKISTDPVGALVTINGELKGNTPFQYSGPSGQVRLKLERDGFYTIEKLLNLEGGKTHDFSYKLEPLKKANGPGADSKSNEVRPNGEKPSVEPSPNTAEPKTPEPPEDKAEGGGESDASPDAVSE